MVGEVVNNILEAEDQAERIVKDGKEQARFLLAEAQKNSDEKRISCVKDCRRISEEIKAEALKEAEKKYAEILAEGKARAEKDGEKYDKNVDKAVQAVLSSIMA